MKKIIIISGLALSLIANPALANCPSGNCAVEINCTTGEITYKDAPVRVETSTPARLEPTPPTHQVVIQTTNSSMGTSGSYEQVQQFVQQVISTPQAPQADPCASGGCTKVIVNATTGVTEILPLSPADIQQRAIDQYMNYARQLELAIAAKDVVIQPYVAPAPIIVDIPTISTANNIVEQPTIKIDSTPVVYVTAEKNGKVSVIKKKVNALFRKKGSK